MTPNAKGEVSQVGGRIASGPFGELSDYERRNFPHHLMMSGQIDVLHRLLALDGAEGGNGWYELRREHDELAEFVSDIQALRRHVLGQGATGAAADVPWVVRYGLIEASISSQADNLSPELMNALVATELMSFGHALAMAREMTSASERAIALALLGAQAAAPADLYEEAVRARNAVSGFAERGHRASRSAVDSVLQEIVPIETALPPWSGSAGPDEEPRPPLYRMFARTFRSLPASDHQRVAALFRLPRRRAAAALLDLIGVKPRRRQRRGFDPLWWWKGPAQMRARELEDVITRPSGTEEVAAALIGLVVSEVPILDDAEERALAVIGEIHDVHTRLIFLARFARVASDPGRAAALVRTCLEPPSRYAQALATGVLALFNEEIGEEALAVALTYRLQPADSFRGHQFGEELEHRSVLVARSVVAKPDIAEMVLPFCLEACGVDESEDPWERHGLQDWFCDSVQAAFDRAIGEAASDPKPPPSVHLEPGKQVRNLTKIAAMLSHAQQRSVLSEVHQKAVSGLADGRQVAAFAAELAGRLPRNQGLAVLAKSQRFSSAGLQEAVGAVAPDAEGLELLQDGHLSKVLLNRLPQAQLLQQLARYEAGDDHGDLGRVIEITLALYAGHGEDRFAPLIERFTRLELFSSNADRVAQIAAAAPPVHLRRIAQLAHQMPIPAVWSRRDAEVGPGRSAILAAVGMRLEGNDREDLIAAAISETSGTYDSSCIDLVRKIAPVLCDAHREQIDRMLAKMKKGKHRLAVLGHLAEAAPEQLGHRYARRVVRSAIWRVATGRASVTEHTLRFAARQAVTRLGPWRLRVLGRVYAGLDSFGSDGVLSRRFAQLGHWREALRRCRSNLLLSANEFLAILPYVPEKERAPLVEETLDLVRRADPEAGLWRGGIFEWCMGLRPYMAPDAWEAFLLERVSAVLTQGRGTGGLEQIEQLLHIDRATPLLSGIPLARLWPLVGRQGLEDRARGRMLADLMIVLPSLAAEGSPQDLEALFAAVEDVCRWWPPQEGAA